MEMRPCVKLVTSHNAAVHWVDQPTVGSAFFPSFRGNYYFVLYLRALTDAHAHTRLSWTWSAAWETPQPVIPRSLGSGTVVIDANASKNHHWREALIPAREPEHSLQPYTSTTNQTV